MSEVNGNTQEAKEEVGQQENGKDKVRKVTNYLLLFVAFMLIFSIISDRIIPITDNARVKGYIVPIKPEVSGKVLDILVQPNQLVNQGDKLAILDESDYQIAVQQAEQNLEIAGQNVGAQTASIASAQAKLTSAIVERQNTKLQAKRVLEMADKGVVSKSDADKARAALATSRAAVVNAEADLDRAKKQMGKEGEENSQVKAALLALEQAQLNLERTVITAPTQGGVSNFSLSEGFYASAGQAIMTFVSTEDIWIEAYYRENSLGNVAVGDEVEVALDFAPGKVVKGRVSSIDWGVDWGQNDQAGKLAQASQQTGWLRQTQMLPITIEFDNEEVTGMLRVGGQADVIVYSGDNFVFNAIGKVWIRLISVLSYVR
ncbi:MULTISPECIES: HlyD family secretion protein [Vibrio]|uniref:Inner membrane protein YibH n=1 Tax=Vibrio celticus TaxID=446372 RepID=A0A1C3JD06_9VIBR|nr:MULTISPECIES: HlyD family secretion protein [Vibrio]MCK8074699.1 HlyD family secretion protein [Vibrio sp. 1CM2L]SBT13000.1 Inner membrane protein YibH [Vibrio celticus]